MRADRAELKNPFTDENIHWPLLLGMDPGAHMGYALGEPRDIVERKSWRTPRVIAIGTTIAPIKEVLRYPPVRGDIRSPREVWPMVEFQYGQRIGTGQISADSVIKLAFRAGYMIRDAAGELNPLVNRNMMFAATPHAWKESLTNGGGTTRKDIFCEKVKRQLAPDELRLLVEALEEYPPGERADRALDLLDAIGVMWALHDAIMKGEDGMRRLRDWRMSPGRIVPNQTSRTKRSAYKVPAKSPSLAKKKPIPAENLDPEQNANGETKQS